MLLLLCIYMLHLIGSGQKLLDSLAETWDFFFCDVLSMLQAIFHPVQVETSSFSPPSLPPSIVFTPFTPLLCSPPPLYSVIFTSLHQISIAFTSPLNSLLASPPPSPLCRVYLPHLPHLPHLSVVFTSLSCSPPSPPCRGPVPPPFPCSSQEASSLHNFLGVDGCVRVFCCLPASSVV